MGVLGHVSNERVNLVNAPLLATQHGLNITEQKNVSSSEYASLLTVELNTTAGSTIIAGTSIRNQPHILRFNEYWIDIVPSGGFMLFTDHQDRPGMIGAVGTITGKHDINVSFMEVGRLGPRGRAAMILGLDDPISKGALEELQAIPGVDAAYLINL